MVILSIETSCDETAVSIVEAKGSQKKPSFKLLGNALFSQAKLHAKYGGVYPNLAKREHIKNIPLLFKVALQEAGLYKKRTSKISKNSEVGVRKILVREPELADFLIKFGKSVKKAKIDLIAVTNGPGLEPALWVGVNFARALGVLWNVSVTPINHMEGHFVSVLFNGPKFFRFPALALLISGGHTELVLSKKILQYKIIGETRDDAVGEAYDKVARMLSLPYPGGPHIAKLAEKIRKTKKVSKYSLPRPMLNTANYDFSFSGLKTAVLYTLKKEKNTTKRVKEEIAFEFENAVTETLIKKTKKAIEEFKPKSLVVSGGVISNVHLRKSFEKLADSYPEISLFIPEKNLSTDNSVMIAVAGFIRSKSNKIRKNNNIRASGTLSLS